MNKGNPHHDEKGQFASAQSSVAKQMRYVPPRNVSSEPTDVQIGPGFTGKAIAKDVNKGGTVHSLVKHANGKYAVYMLAENYAGHVRGGIAKTWRYVGRDLDWNAAKSLYDKRLQGKR